MLKEKTVAEAIEELRKLPSHSFLCVRTPKPDSPVEEETKWWAYDFETYKELPPLVAPKRRRSNA